MRRIFHTFKLICFLTILSLSFHDINAKAFEDRSVIFLCYENVDGKNSDSCSLNNKIYKYLQGQGAFVVDPNQAAQVRNHLSPEKLSSKGGLKGANLMDAEFVVLLKIKASKQVIPGKTMAFQSYLVKYDLSVINVSRANIILNYEAKMTGLGLNADSAIESAAQKFWKKENISLAKTFDTAFEDLSGADLWVFDLKDFKAVRKLDKHLKSLKTVSKVKRVHFGKGLAKWRIKIKGENSPDSLADSLENEKSLFLETQGINGNLIQLAYNPKAKIKMAILIEAKSNKKMPKWFSESQTQTIQNQLLTFGYIKPINDKNQNHILKLKVEAKKSKKKQYLLKYSLQSASGKTLSGLSKIGQEGNLANLQKEALNEIFNNFHSYLKKNPQEFASLSGLLDSPKTFYAKLAFNNKDGSIFGAQLERYRKEGLGFAQSEGKFDELKIRTKISGYGEFSPWLEAKEGKLPIIPNFESSLSSIRKPTTLRIVAEIQATKGERLYRKTLSSTGLYYPNNAINWNNLDSFSAFIDPSAPWAKKLIGTALNSRIEKPNRALGLAAEIWAQIIKQGINYVPDPQGQYGSSQIDTVELPNKTISSKSGDCDDLTALFASAFEAAGIETRIVTTPGHILLAIDSSLYATAWPLVAKSQKDILDLGGKMFIPLEATALKSNFWSAAAKGMKEVKKHSKNLEILNPRNHWAIYTPLAQDDVSLKTAKKSNNGWKKHLKNLKRSLPKNAYSRVRFHSFQGEIKFASKSINKIKNKNLRTLAKANLNLISGDLNKAFKGYISLKDSRAKMNAFLVATLSGDQANAQKMLSTLDQEKIFKAFGLGIEKSQTRGDRKDKGPELALQDMLSSLKNVMKNKKKVDPKMAKAKNDRFSLLAGKRGADPDQKIALRFLVKW